MLILSGWIDRLLAREGLSAEQLARDLKSFEIKVFNFCVCDSQMALSLLNFFPAMNGRVVDITQFGFGFAFDAFSPVSEVHLRVCRA